LATPVAIASSIGGKGNTEASESKVLVMGVNKVNAREKDRKLKIPKNQALLKPGKCALIAV
jgi:hypothetical protein